VTVTVCPRLVSTEVASPPPARILLSTSDGRGSLSSECLPDGCKRVPRDIGAVYVDEANSRSLLSVQDAFDTLIFFDEVTPTRPEPNRAARPGLPVGRPATTGALAPRMQSLP
jgi:hypothetical protein